jgi:hypothetical protein
MDRETRGAGSMEIHVRYDQVEQHRAADAIARRLERCVEEYDGGLYVGLYEGRSWRSGASSTLESLSVIRGSRDDVLDMLGVGWDRALPADMSAAKNEARRLGASLDDGRELEPYSPVNHGAPGMEDGRTTDERYQDGDCTVCGEPLDDYSIGHGYERCGECKLAPSHWTATGTTSGRESR